MSILAFLLSNTNIWILLNVVMWSNSGWCWYTEHKVKLLNDEQFISSVLFGSGLENYKSWKDLIARLIYPSARFQETNFDRHLGMYHFAKKKRWSFTIMRTLLQIKTFENEKLLSDRVETAECNRVITGREVLHSQLLIKSLLTMLGKVLTSCLGGQYI